MAKEASRGGQGEVRRVHFNEVVSVTEISLSELEYQGQRRKQRGKQRADQHLDELLDQVKSGPILRHSTRAQAWTPCGPSMEA